MVASTPLQSLGNKTDLLWTKCYYRMCADPVMPDCHKGLTSAGIEGFMPKHGHQPLGKGSCAAALGRCRSSMRVATSSTELNPSLPSAKVQLWGMRYLHEGRQFVVDKVPGMLSTVA